MPKDPRLARLQTYMEAISGCLGHADRDQPMQDYLTGLLMPGERKSMEPIAARLAPRAVGAKHQSLHHFVSESPWDPDRLLDAVRAEVLPGFERIGGIQAWIVDDTGMPKKGRDSVGVARQYCGVLGKQDNCQVAVSVSLANQLASLPAFWRLYLPESWAGDVERRRKARVPDDIVFRTKWEIALAGIDRLLSHGVRRAPVLADAGYGVVTGFRDGLAQRQLTYAVGITSAVCVWRPGTQPLPPKPWTGIGRPPTAWRGTPDHHPIAVSVLAKELPPSAWKQVTWRQGSDKPLTSRFAAIRIRTANRADKSSPRPEEWLVIEWPEHQPEPTKWHLSNLPASTTLKDLVSSIHLRWRIERDYQELKDGIGFDHFEGRSWRGFHHRAALCIAAYGFIAAERARLFPPDDIAFIPPPSGRQTKPRGSPC